MRLAAVALLCVAVQLGAGDFVLPERFKHARYDVGLVMWRDNVLLTVQ